MNALTHAPMQKKARSRMLGPPDKLGTLYVSKAGVFFLAKKFR